jgi:predicted ABC-type ATPase
VVVAIAGPNGAGKSTFYETQLKSAGLVFVNADQLARQLEMDAYTAASAADQIRRELMRQRESFVFETVFSDPVGEKVAFLLEMERAGYDVTLCFIGVSTAAASEQRVSMRVSKGGHDVPSDKLAARYPRTLENLRRAMEALAEVWVYDNDDLSHPYRLVARCENGRVVMLGRPVPKWLRPLLPKS